MGASMGVDERAGGFFCASFLVTCTIPFIFMAIRWWRKNKLSQETLFEFKLGQSAKRSVERRAFYFNNNVEDPSAMQKLSQGLERMRSSSFSDTNSKSNESQKNNSTLAHFQHAIREGHVYWGIEDVLVPKGEVSLWFTLPPGLLEDFIFFACNNIQPLPFLFADRDNPISFTVDYAVYCNSQVFALLIFLLTDRKPAETKIFINVLMFPIIIFCEFWLSRMIGCPCLKEAEGATIAEGDRDDGGAHCEDWESYVKRTLRVLGGLMAVPLLFMLIIILVIVAFAASFNSHFGDLIGLFLLNATILSFFLKLALLAVQYLWFVTPLHVNICGVNFIKINYWLELQWAHEDFQELEDLSVDSVREMKAKKKKKLVSEADVFHMNCYILRYLGLPDDSHYRMDICHPTCYFTRCCNSICDFLTGEKQATRLSKRHAYTRSVEKQGLVAHEASLVDGTPSTSIEAMERSDSGKFATSDAGSSPHSARYQQSSTSEVL